MKHNLKTFPDTEDSDNAYEYAEDIARWFKGFEKELRELFGYLSSYEPYDLYDWIHDKGLEKEILGE